MRSKKVFSFVLTAIMLLAIPFSVQAASMTSNGITLYTPDSFASCSPSSMITTAGVGDRAVKVWFFYHNPQTNHEILGLSTG